MMTPGDVMFPISFVMSYGNLGKKLDFKPWFCPLNYCTHLRNRRLLSNEGWIKSYLLLAESRLMPKRTVNSEVRHTIPSHQGQAR